jgi:hypothetical protein
LESSKKAVSLSIISFLCESLNPIQMMKLQMQAEMNAQNLLLSAAQLPLDELEQFFAELSRLVTRKKSESVLNRDKIAHPNQSNGVIARKNGSLLYLDLQNGVEYPFRNGTFRIDYIGGGRRSLKRSAIKVFSGISPITQNDLAAIDEKIGFKQSKIKKWLNMCPSKLKS